MLANWSFVIPVELLESVLVELAELDEALLEEVSKPYSLSASSDVPPALVM